MDETMHCIITHHHNYNNYIKLSLWDRQHMLELYVPLSVSLLCIHVCMLIPSLLHVLLLFESLAKYTRHSMHTVQHYLYSNPCYIASGPQCTAEWQAFIHCQEVTIMSRHSATANSVHSGMYVVTM